MIAALFPGQGSQAPGMGKSFFDHSAASRDVFQRISEAVGRNLQEICFEFDEETLRQTDNAQIALFTVSLAAYAAYVVNAAQFLFKLRRARRERAA